MKRMASLFVGLCDSVAIALSAATVGSPGQPLDLRDP